MISVKRTHINLYPSTFLLTSDGNLFVFFYVFTCYIKMLITLLQTSDTFTFVRVMGSLPG